VVRDGILASSGIDYCTATGRTKGSQVFLREIGLILIGQQRLAGARIRPWRAYGYEGVGGGAVSLGTGDHGTILRLSGGIAATYGGKVCRYADSVSRIDLQSTVRFYRDVPRLDRHHACEVRRAASAGGRKRNTTHLITGGKGNTLNIGSRASNYYGRIYDKHRESGDAAYRNCWRYELEVKGDASTPLARRMAEAESPEAEAAAVVHGWFSRAGCRVRYGPGLANPLAQIGAVDSDAARFLAWMKQQVCPGLRRLQEWYDRDQLIAFLFDGRDLSEMQLIRREADPQGSRQSGQI